MSSGSRWWGLKLERLLKGEGAMSSLFDRRELDNYFVMGLDL